MTQARTQGSRGTGRVAVRLVLSLAFASSLMAYPSSARATEADELQAQLAAAVARYDELSARADEASSALAEIDAQLDQVSADIEATQVGIDEASVELARKQETLSEVIVRGYKQRVSLVGILMSSTSFDELVSNVYYANKVSEMQQQAISDVRTLQQSLEAEMNELRRLQDELEQACEEQKAQLGDFQTAQAEQRSYVDSLSEDLQVALVAELTARQEAEETAQESQTSEASAADDQGVAGQDAGTQDTQQATESDVSQGDEAQDDADEPAGQPPAAVDASADDLYVGVFYTSDYDFTDTVYASTDGNTFYRVATAYQQTIAGGQYEPGHWCHACPSIMYHNGYFWMISGWNRNDGRFWPEISYSTDLVNWSDPLGSGFVGTNGVALAEMPTSGGVGFDTVAPEWFVDTDGTVYIVVSCGRYGAFHGAATQDSMQTYLIRVNELSTSGTPSRYGTPAPITFRAEPAVKLSVNTDGADRIDGALFKEGGTYYLLVKRDGLTNEIWRSTNLSANDWQLVNGSVTYGYEGPSMVRVGGTYHLYVDHVIGATANGVWQATSGDIAAGGSWAISPVAFQTFGGQTLPARHGTVIRISRSAQPAAWETVHRLLSEGA